jgi:hypothetical protein
MDGDEIEPTTRFVELETMQTLKVYKVNMIGTQRIKTGPQKGTLGSIFEITVWHHRLLLGNRLGVTHAENEEGSIEEFVELIKQAPLSRGNGFR